MSFPTSNSDKFINGDNDCDSVDRSFLDADDLSSWQTEFDNVFDCEDDLPFCSSNSAVIHKSDIDFGEVSELTVALLSNSCVLSYGYMCNSCMQELHM